MENLSNLLKSLQKFGVKGIYINDELEDFKEFLEAFEGMDIEDVVQVKDFNIFYLILGNGYWNKVSVYSLDELEELDMMGL